MSCGTCAINTEKRGRQVLGTVQPGSFCADPRQVTLHAIVSIPQSVRDMWERGTRLKASYRQGPRGLQVSVSGLSVHSTFEEVEEVLDEVFAGDEEGWVANLVDLRPGGDGRWHVEVSGERDRPPPEFTEETISMVGQDFGTALRPGAGSVPREVNYPIKVYEVTIRIDTDTAFGDAIAGCEGRLREEVEGDFEVSRAFVQRSDDGQVWISTQIEVVPD